MLGAIKNIQRKIKIIFFCKNAALADIYIYEWDDIVVGIVVGIVGFSFILSDYK